MTQYILDLIEQVSTAINTNRLTGQPTIFELLNGLSEELDRLDPRDFGYSSRSEFVLNRLIIRAYKPPRTISGSDYPKILASCKILENSLNDYLGENSRAITRDFSFMSDVSLQQIVIRDYKELSLVLLPGGAWKSVVVLAGSILEAILNDTLTSTPTILASAKACSSAPPSGKLEKGEWKLQDLISVAEELDKIPKASAKAIDQILRDYRNFIHPKKEIRSKHPCTEAQALMAKGALDAVCNHLSAHP